MSITVVYGVSGSGKSTHARELKGDDSSVVLLERDIIRCSVHAPFVWGGWEYGFPSSLEGVVSYLWNVKLYAALEDRYDVIISDTLCKVQDRRNIKEIAEYHAVNVEFIRMNVALEECIKRDANRHQWSVGEAVLERQWANLSKYKGHV